MSADSSPIGGRWLGGPLPRLQDAALLRSDGHITGDVTLPSEVHVALVRSPHAHTRIAAADTKGTFATSSMIAVYTDDVVAEGLGSIPFQETHIRADGSGIAASPRLALTLDLARFVGDPVAMVVAETRNQVMDAAELADVNWEPQDSVVYLQDASKGASAIVWPAEENAVLDALASCECGTSICRSRQREFGGRSAH